MPAEISCGGGAGGVHGEKLGGGGVHGRGTGEVNGEKLGTCRGDNCSSGGVRSSGGVCSDISSSGRGEYSIEGE